MSMHMIRGVQVHGRHKAKRKPGWREAMAHHEAFLKKMGVKGGASDYRAPMPDLSTYKPGSYHDYDVGGDKPPRWEYQPKNKMAGK